MKHNNIALLLLTGLVWVVIAFVSACSGRGSSVAPNVPEQPPALNMLPANPLAISPLLAGVGLVYVADYGSNSVTAYHQSDTGNVLPVTTISGASTALYSPQSVAIGPSTGKIYVINDGSNTLTVYTPGSTDNVAPTQNIVCGLMTPRGVAVDGHGNIYVANYGNNSIAVFAPLANGCVFPVRVIGGTSTGLARPIALAIGAATGKIYVANYASPFSITEYSGSASGNTAPLAKISGSNTALAYPIGVALDASSNIYVANLTTNAITVYGASATGNVLPLRKIAGISTGLSAPRGLGVNSSGVALAANYNTNAVTMYGAGANGNVAPIRTIAGTNTKLNHPWGLALGPTPTPAPTPILYVGQRNTGFGVSEFTLSGSPVRSFTSSAVTSNWGIALDSADNLYISESTTIAVFAPHVRGTPMPIRTISGSNTKLFCNGGIGFDKAGNLYVADCSSPGDVSVFPFGASGNAAPSRVISGSNTGFQSGDPQDAKIAPAGPRAGDLFVALKATKAVAIFSSTATGNVAPLATISGASTGLNYPYGITFDSAGYVYVANYSGTSVTVYAPGASGNASPTRTIAGSNTTLAGPLAVAVDSTGKLYVGDSFDVLVFAAGATGNVKPILTIPLTFYPGSIAIGL